MELSSVTRLFADIFNLESAPVKIASRIGIYPRGEVMWLQKMRVSMSCRMHFEDMPFDEQHCIMPVGSHRGNAKTIQFFLKATNGQPDYIEIGHPYKTTRRLADGGTQEFRLAEGGLTAAVTEPDTVEFTFRLQRNSGYYERHIMAPMYFFVRLHASPMLCHAMHSSLFMHASFCAPMPC